MNCIFFLVIKIIFHVILFSSFQYIKFIYIILEYRLQQDMNAKVIYCDRIKMNLNNNTKIKISFQSV